MAQNFYLLFIFIAIVSYHYEIASGASYNDLYIEDAIPSRLYLPSAPYSNGKLPLVVYYHGGAFLSGSTKEFWYNDFIQKLVDRSNVIALSVDYQLANLPELVSGCYRDSWNALEYVASHSNGSGSNPTLNTKVDFRKVYLAGDSAGGNIAHNMAMRMGSSSDKINGLQIKGIALFCPFFWGFLPIGFEPIDPYIGRVVENNLWIIASGSLNLDDTRINPLVDPELPTLGASKVLVITGHFDPLYYRGLYYAQALRSNGYKGKVYEESYSIWHDEFIFVPNYLVNLPNLLGKSDIVERASSFFNGA